MVTFNKKNLTIASALLVIATSAFAAKPGTSTSKVDPFVGGTWHAVGQTWPGTAIFNERTKELRLAPVGASEIMAVYSFKHDTARKGAPPAGTSGVLTMKSTDGRTVTAKYTIKDKNLSLLFKNGQREETYIKMTPAEELAEQERINKLAREGKLTPDTRPIQLEEPNFMKDILSQ